MAILLLIPATIYALVLGVTWRAVHKDYRSYPLALKFGIASNLVILGLPLSGGIFWLLELIALAAIAHFIFCAQWLADDWQLLRPNQRVITALLSISPVPLFYVFWMQLIARLYDSLT